MSEMIWENVDDEDGSSEYPFLCFPVQPTLQEMATYRFCQAIACHTYASSLNTNYLRKLITKRDGMQRRKYSSDLIQGLKIAKPVKEMLIRAMKKTHTNLNNWMRRLGDDATNRKIFNELATLQMDISWCVWLPNGQIDYRRSAIEMLKSGRLDETQKFIVASKSCLEDEIKTICSTSLSSRVQELEFDNDPLQFYWLCYLKNKLSRVYQFDSEKTIAVSCYEKEEMIGFEYFWLLMTNDDRISTGEKIFRERGCRLEWAVLERLFSSISFSSTKSLARLSAQYLARSACHSDSGQHQLRIWHRFKDEIEASDFAFVIRDVFPTLFASNSEDRMCILVDIWDTAYDRHKKSRYSEDLYQLIVKNFIVFYDEEDPICSAACDMLHRILSLKPQRERSKLFKQHANAFFSNIKSLEMLEKTLDLCLPSAIEKSQFKNTLCQSETLQDICVSLLQRGNKTELNDKLEWLFADRGPNAVLEYKRLILTFLTRKFESRIVSFLSSVYDWNKLGELVDEVYANFTQFALEVKRCFIDRAISYRPYKNLNQHFDQVKLVIEQVLPIRDLKCMKRKQLDNLVKQFSNFTYWNEEHNGDEVFLPRLVAWLCDYDEKSISEFKKSVPHGVILDSITMMNGIVERIRNGNLSRSHLNALLRRLDRYLEWFLGSNEKVRKFKVQSIELRTFNVKKFRRVFTGEAIKFREVVWKWMCNGDKKAVRRFEAQR